jgi:hypothetical protein
MLITSVPSVSFVVFKYGAARLSQWKRVALQGLIMEVLMFE